MAKKALIDRLEIPASQVHRIVTENTTPEFCAESYERIFVNSSRLLPEHVHPSI